MFYLVNLFKSVIIYLNDKRLDKILNNISCLQSIYKSVLKTVRLPSMLALARASRLYCVVDAYDSLLKYNVLHYLCKVM